MAIPHKRSALTLLAASVAAVSALLSPGAQAEGKISIAQQFGIGYLILDVVRDQQLIEKHGKEQGLDIKVDWNSISGATAMNEALLAGAPARFLQDDPLADKIAMRKLAAECMRYTPVVTV